MDKYFKATGEQKIYMRLLKASTMKIVTSTVKVAIHLRQLVPGRQLFRPSCSCMLGSAERACVLHRERGISRYHIPLVATYLPGEQRIGHDIQRSAPPLPQHPPSGEPNPIHIRWLADPKLAGLEMLGKGKFA